MKRGKIIIAATAVLLFIAALFWVLLTTRTSPPSVEFIDQAAVRSAMKWPLWKVALDRCLSLVPPLRKALNPTLNVNATLMELKGAPHDIITNVLSGLPEVATNAFRAWILTSTQLAELNLQNSRYVRIISSPRVTTMEGVGATVSSGKSTLIDSNRCYSGVEVDVYPKVSKGHIQLLASALLTDSTLLGRTGTTVLSVVTNFHIGLRTSFPSGGGVFVVDTKTSNAVLISAQEQK